MKRPVLIISATLAVAFSLAAQTKPFDVVEATIPEMRAAMEQKRVT